MNEIALAAAKAGIVVPSLAEQVDARRTALLLVDVQAHLSHDTSYLVGGDEIAARIARLVAAGRAAGVTCIFSRGVERDSSNSAVWVSRHVTKPFRVGVRTEGSAGAAFHPDVAPQPDDVVLVKTRYSCFVGTDLDQILRSRGLDSLVIAGVATNVCVEATAVEAFQRNYWTIVVGDCCTARTAEEHARALLDCERNWGIVANSTTIMAAWRP